MALSKLLLTMILLTTIGRKFLQFCISYVFVCMSLYPTLGVLFNDCFTVLFCLFSTAT